MSIIAADFAARTARQGAFVRIYEIAAGRRSHVMDVPVADKREARRVAGQYNATPWNF